MRCFWFYRTMCCRRYFIAFFWLIAGAANAQVLTNYTVYTVNDGLSQSSVYHVFQDAGGFIWFGTGDGLNRFDGYEFTVYKHRFRDSLSLPNSTIRGLADDSSGNLWVGTDKGLSRINRYTGKIDRIVAPWRTEVQVIGRKGSELFVYVPASGFYALSTGTGSIRAVFKTDRYIYPKTWMLHGNTLHFITSERKWLAVDIASGRIQKYNLPPDALTGTGYALAPFGRDIFLAYSGQLVRVNNQGEIRPFAEFKSEIQQVYADATYVWVALKDSGICLMDVHGKRLEWSASSSWQAGIPGKAFINRIQSDRTGNVWVSVEGLGLVKFSPHQRKFRHYRSGQASDGNFIKCFAEDLGGSLYIGSYKGGLSTMDTAGNFRKIHLPGGNDPTVTALVTEKNGALIIGTNRGLYRYHPNRNETPEQLFPESISEVTHLFLNAEGKLFIIGSRSFTWYPGQAGSQLTPVKSDIHYAKAIFEDSRGNLWCGHDAGITVFMPSGKVMRLSESGFPRVKVRAFYEDKEGRMWIATEMGLVKMSDLLVRKWYGREEGLPDEFIYGILGDLFGNLWMSTNKGLVKFNIPDEKFTAYRPEDGLQSWEFNTGAFFQSRKGTMYFGGVNGFNAFEPDKVAPLRTKPVVKLTGIKSLGETLALDTLPEFKKMLQLPWSLNTLSFEFAAIDFTEPDENTYAYQLLGLEKDWNEVGKRRTAYYTNLPPGSYRLMARAANPDGVWGEPVQLIHLVIRPPFYKTWWFRLALLATLAALVIFLVYLISTYKMRRRLAVLERQKEMEVLRNRISRDIHDDIGAGLSKIALLSDLADRELEAHGPVNPSLKKIAGSAREMMVNLREIIWAINPRQDDLSGMVIYFRNYTSEFLEDTGIQWEFTGPDILPQKSVSPDIKRNLFLILKEGLNNAVKHASATAIQVEISVGNGSIRLLIKDNGKGFDADREETRRGNGLNNLRARAEQIGGDLHIHSARGEGTSIRIDVRYE